MHVTPGAAAQAVQTTGHACRQLPSSIMMWGVSSAVQAVVQVPEPFQLPGDALHQHAEAAKQQYLEEEEQKRKAQAAFKARTAPHSLLAQLHCWAA